MQNNSNQALTAKAVLKGFTAMVGILASAFVIIALIAAAWVMRGTAH